MGPKSAGKKEIHTPSPLWSLFNSKVNLMYETWWTMDKPIIKSLCSFIY